MKNKTTIANISHTYPCGILSAMLLCALLSINIPASFSKENYLPNSSTLIAQNVLQGTVQMSDQLSNKSKVSNSGYARSGSTYQSRTGSTYQASTGVSTSSRQGATYQASTGISTSSRQGATYQASTWTHGGNKTTYQSDNSTEAGNSTKEMSDPPYFGADFYKNPNRKRREQTKNAAASTSQGSSITQESNANGKTKEPGILMQLAQQSNESAQLDTQETKPLKGTVQKSDKKDEGILMQFATHNDEAPPEKQKSKQNIDNKVKTAAKSTSPGPLSALAASNENTGNYLKGSIKHADKLSPLSNLLKAGVTFSEQNMPKLTGSTGWYWIPTWFAGTYSTQKNTTYFYKDLQTGNSEAIDETHTAISKETIGFQKDGKGNLWEYQYGPYRQRVIGDTDFTIQQVQEHEPLEVTGNKVVIRYKGIDVRVDKVTNKIKRTTQNESIQVYTKDSDNTIKCQSSMKVFNTDGNPLSLQKLYSIKTRIEPFSEVATFKDKDMRKDFVNYLIGKKRYDLLPAYSKDYIEEEKELKAVAFPTRLSTNSTKTKAKK